MPSMNTQARQTGPVPGGFWGGRNRDLTLLVAVLAATFLTFLPSLRNGFVNWDDQVNVYRNPHVLGANDWGSFLESAIGIFTTHVMGNYNPLPILTFAVEKMVFGLESPEWFHLTNILLHLICVFLVFRISRLLGLDAVPAAFCALLFGIHPMRVESVAWVTERKDVLMGTFYFLALAWYVRDVRSSFRERHRWLILGCFVLALLSKIQAVVLPLSMLLVDYYYGRRPSFRLVLEKWHYFLLSLATGLAGIYFLRLDGGIGSNAFFSFFERLFLGSYAYVVYLVKSVLPYRLVPVYPYPASLEWFHYASMVPALLLLGLVCWAYRQGRKRLVFGLLFFTFNIMFLLQVLGAGQGFLADRFTYIAYFGLFFLYAWGLQRLQESSRAAFRWACAGALLVLAVYGAVSFRQNRVWKDGEALWTHVIDHYPNTALNWENRAGFYSEAGRVEEALRDYSRAIALRPDKAELYYLRGTLFLEAGEPEGLRSAAGDYQRAAALSPMDPEYRLGKGIAHLRMGEPERALESFDAAERLAPENPAVSFYRGRAHFELGRFGKAQADLERYLAANPGDPASWSNLGVAARMNGQYQKSLDAFDRAIRLNPENMEYYLKRLVTYYEMGDLERVREELAFLEARGFEGLGRGLERLEGRDP